MALSPAVRVGILVFLAIAAFILVFLFLKGYSFLANRYNVIVTFDNALGLIEGAEVRMAGVPIGKVGSVTLDPNQRARVLLDINRKYCIPRGSRFVIQSGVLISQQFVEVFPNRNAHGCLPRKGKPAQVHGEMPVRIEELLPRAQVILSNLVTTSESLKKLIGDEQLQRNIRVSAQNIAEATTRFNQTLAMVQGTAIESQDDVRMVLANLMLASENVRGMTQDLQAFVAEPELRENIRGTAASARRSAETIERAISHVEQSANNIEAVIASVERTSGSVERAAGSAERTAGSVEALVTDPQLQADIRATIYEARQAAEGAHQAVERVNRFLGGGKCQAGPYTRGNNAYALYDQRLDRLRLDVATSLPLADNRFLELGVYDLGVGNHGIVQMGQPLNGHTDLRYGIYASRLGVGLDQVFSPRAFGRLDLYNTEDVTLDGRIGYRLNKNLGMLLGLDDIFGQNEGTLGVQYGW